MLLTVSSGDFPFSLDEGLSSERVRALPEVSGCIGGPRCHRWEVGGPCRGHAWDLSLTAGLISALGLVLRLEVQLGEQDKGETEEAGAQSRHGEALGAELRVGVGRPAPSPEGGQDCLLSLGKVKTVLGPEPRSLCPRCDPGHPAATLISPLNSFGNHTAGSRWAAM